MSFASIDGGEDGEYLGLLVLSNTIKAVACSHISVLIHLLGLSLSFSKPVSSGFDFLYGTCCSAVPVPPCLNYVCASQNWLSTGGQLQKSSISDPVSRELRS